MSFTLLSILALLAHTNASPIGPIPVSHGGNAPTATVIASEPHYTATVSASSVVEITATQIPSSVFDITATQIPSSVFDITATQIPSSVFDITATQIPSSVFDITATQIPSSVFDITATVSASSVLNGPTATVIASGIEVSGYPGCSHTGYAVVPASAETTPAKYRFTLGGNIVLEQE